MLFGLGGSYEVFVMQILTTTSTLPNDIAAVEAFNYAFSITFQLGMLAMITTWITLTLSRS